MEGIKRMACASVVTVGLVLTAVTTSVGTAAAQPGPPCGGSCRGPGDHGGPGGPGEHGGVGAHDRGEPGADDRGRFDGPPPPPPPGLAWRSIDQGRFDHQPFNYNGNWVTPIFNPYFNTWGFWLFGLWIPL